MLLLCVCWSGGADAVVQFKGAESGGRACRVTAKVKKDSLSISTNSSILPKTFKIIILV